MQHLPLGTPFALITKKYFGALTAAADKSGIDRYFSVFIFIGKAEGKITQQTVADYMRMDKAAMVRIIDYLQNEKLITKKTNNENRREFILKLSTKGKQVLKKLDKKMEVLHGKVFDGMNTTEKKMLFQLLEKISYNLDHLPAAEFNWELKSTKKKK